MESLHNLFCISTSWKEQKTIPNQRHLLIYGLGRPFICKWVFSTIEANEYELDNELGLVRYLIHRRGSIPHSGMATRAITDCDNYPPATHNRKGLMLNFPFAREYSSTFLI